MSDTSHDEHLAATNVAKFDEIYGPYFSRGSLLSDVDALKPVRLSLKALKKAIFFCNFED